MIRNSYSRLLSEYLDGEIGLADKRLLEEAMRSDPQLREEFHEQRRLGLVLSSSMPEVQVHPQQFRQRVEAALDQRQAFLTPQRAFASAMAVVLVTVGITFGLFIYQERLFGSDSLMSMAQAQPAPVAPRPTHCLGTLVIESTAEQFYSRLLADTQAGVVQPELTAQLAQQTGILEGAACRGELDATVYVQPLPSRQLVRLTLLDAQALKGVADGLTANRSALALASARGELITQQEYLLAYPSGAEIPVQLIFQQ